MPGQAATAFEHGKPGLSLSGAGTFNPIEHGKPRASTIERVPVPKSGLSAPRNAASGHAIHALGPIDKGAKAAGVPKPSHQAAGGHVSKAGVVRISSSLGEVRLNVHKVTNGLAHGAVAPGQVRNANANAGPDTVWSDGKSNTPASNSSVQTAATTSGAAAAGSSASAASAAIAAAAAGASSDSPGANNGNSGGNGNSGNNGNGNSGNNGNGNHGATGNGRGNNGNGSGNGGGNGHGNAYGHNRR
jgi:hypothetical protein